MNVNLTLFTSAADSHNEGYAPGMNLHFIELAIVRLVTRHQTKW